MGKTAAPLAVEEQQVPVDGRALYRKISWRLIPYMFLLYIVAYLDRVNVGFAAMDMQRDLHFSNTVYGTGAGIFFLGSALFDLPSNLLLLKVGPRVWIARIMISWGIVSTAMMFMHSATSFYVLRFLLGVCEAGFFPGMIIYLTYWFPSHERARAVARFMTATSLAGVVGGPLSSYLLQPRRPPRTRRLAMALPLRRNSHHSARHLRPLPAQGRSRQGRMDEA